MSDPAKIEGELNDAIIERTIARAAWTHAAYERKQWQECARMFWIATAPNGHCINIPVLKKALAEYDRLKEGK